MLETHWNSEILENQNILITGGAGFIGSHIVEYLLERGNRIWVLDNFSTGKLENFKSFSGQERLEIIEGDINHFETVLNLMKNVGWVFHQAALVSVPLSIQQPQVSFRNNIIGTFNIFEAARLTKINRIVFASSAAVYGNSYFFSLSEEQPCVPLSPYALEKVYAEQLSTLYYQLYGLSSVGLRYFNVYGPRQNPKSEYSSVISIFVEQLSNGKTPCIYGDGEQTRDFVYVKDVVAANIYAMEKANEGSYLFNVGTGKSISINQLFEIINKLLKTMLEPHYRPHRQGDISHSCANVKYIYELLGWQSQWQIEQGLEILLFSEDVNN